jgi:hypothetical protein
LYISCECGAAAGVGGDGGLDLELMFPMSTMC